MHLHLHLHLRCTCTCTCTLACRYCPACEKHQQATNKFDLWSLLEVLVIHLERFFYNRYWRDKIDTVIDFPLKVASSCVSALLTLHIQGLEII